MQTRLGSFIESWINILIGFGINYGANIVVLPWLWDPADPYKSAFHIGIVFTVISQIRSYVIRRYFNGLHFDWNKEKEPA